MSDKKSKHSRKVNPPIEHSPPGIAWKIVISILGSIATLVGLVVGGLDFINYLREGYQDFLWLGLIVVGLTWLIILWLLFKQRNIYGILWLAVTVIAAVVSWRGMQSYNQTQEDKVIVLVAQFDGPEDIYGLHDQIIEDLRQATKEYDDTVIIDGKEVVTAGQGSEYARETGEKVKADLVIWAWYRPTEDPNITMHFENLSPGEITVISESEIYQPPSTLSELRSFEIQRQLGTETSTLVSFLTGLLRLKVGDYQIALERFGQVLDAEDISTYINPKTLHLYVGLSHQVLGELEQSVSHYDKVIELDPNLIEAYGNRGNAYNDMKQFSRAIEDYDIVSALDPEDYRAFYNRGLAYFHLGQYERAIQDYDHAIEIKPNYVWAYNNRGAAHLVLKQYELAIQDHNMAIMLDPRYPVAYFNRGLAYEALGQYRLAIKDFDKTIQLAPDYVNAYLRRGITYMDLDQYDDAIKDFTQTIALRPDSLDAYVNRGVSYGIVGQYERAISDLNQAIKIDPQDPDAYKNRALAYQKIGKIAEAEADFKKYEELTGQKP
jgi:tetratricopeptide (TPR) repeat protein